jgi:CrcB protein
MILLDDVIQIRAPFGIERLEPDPNWRLFLVIGVPGGYTTFSSFEYEALQAMRDGARLMGMIHVVGSVVPGYRGVWLGSFMARL